MFPFFLMQERSLRRDAIIHTTAPVAPWSEEAPAPKHGVRHIYSASSWNPDRIFDGVKPVGLNEEMRPENRVISPSSNFSYREVILPRGHILGVRVGRKYGVASFDDDVAIPQIHEKGTLWMSYTPQEVMTCRLGVKFAKGHVVIAGLGMGWILSRVAKKKSVKKITLVEISRDLCEWVLPRIDVNGKDLSVVVGDANIEVPKIEADVALWDIWKKLHEVDGDDVKRMHKKCKVGRTWFWGAGSHG